MKLINVNQSQLEKYYNNEQIVLYVKLVPYKNNTCIKVYFEGEPIGDIPEEFIEEYTNKDSAVLFINKEFDDNTGLFNFIVTTIL